MAHSRWTNEETNSLIAILSNSNYNALKASKIFIESTNSTRTLTSVYNKAKRVKETLDAKKEETVTDNLSVWQKIKNWFSWLIND